MKNKIKFGLLAMLASAVAVPMQAQKTLTGEAVFYAESRHSLDDCKEAALQMARQKALEDEYGRTVSDEVFSHESNRSGKEESYFQALSSSEVRGIWIADEAAPRYEVSHGDDGLYIVKCTVRGKTRPLSNEAPEFKSVVLRNGDSDKFASTQFKHGDNMRLLFKAPTNGYVAVYLACPDGTAYALLPYRDDDDGMAPVKANQEYVIFSPAHNELGNAEEMQLTAEESVERNRLYVLFSPNEFTKAVDGDGGQYAPRTLSFADFSKWLSNRRIRDPKMGLHIHPITIEKQ